MPRTDLGYEGSLRLRLFGRQIRLYLGHSIHNRRQARTWGATDTGWRGAFVVPWGCRAVGVQWRRLPDAP